MSIMSAMTIPTDLETIVYSEAWAVRFYYQVYDQVIIIIIIIIMNYHQVIGDQVLLFTGATWNFYPGVLAFSSKCT